MIATGQTSIVELNADLEGDFVNGVRAVRRWRGLRNDLLGYVPFINAPGVKWSLRDDNPPIGLLEARFADPQDGSQPNDPASLNTLWTMTGNNLEKDVLEHPDLSEDDAGEIEYKFGIAQDDGDYSTFYGTFSNPVAEDIFKLKAKGVEKFILPQIVLRRTTTVPPGSGAIYSTTNLGKVFTATAQLITMEVVDLTVAGTLPAGQWLKIAPDIRQLSNGKFEIENEWWHADTWSPVLYPAVT